MATTSVPKFDPPHCFRVWFRGWWAVLVDAGSAADAKEIAERQHKEKAIKVEDLDRGRK